MSLSRLFAMFEIGLLGHVLNPFWKTRMQRRKRRTDLTAKIVSRYFKKYLPAVEKVIEEKPINNDKGEKIWTMWLQGEDKAPALVKACFRSVRRHCSQELVVLDEKTVFDYITLPEKIIKKYKSGKIGHAHFADICRVELLYEHGGF